jgi:ATP-binding cassette subfamily F protein 3
MTVISAANLALAYGDVEIFSGVDLRVEDDGRIGIVGPNGSGKSTLLKLLVGELEPDAGSVHITRDARVGYVPQDPKSPSSGTIRDQLMTAFQELRRLETELESATLKLEQSELRERERAEAHYSDLLDRYEASGGYSYLHNLERVAAGVGLSSESLELPATTASGGEGTRAALARALLSSPDVLVLDEPTNYLDLEGLTWLEGFLSHNTKAFLVVSHDRYFLDRVVNQVWEMDRGRLQTFPGNYSAYQRLREERRLRQQREYQRQQEHIESEQEFIRRYGAGQRAREARGRARRLERLERIEAPKADAGVTFSGITAGRTGHFVLQSEGLVVGFTEGEQATELLSVPDLKLERGSRTAIIGGNGAGKTTLLRTLLGLVPPISGRVLTGQGVETGYYSQESGELPEDSTVLDAFLDVRNLPLGEARSYLARFLFQGDEVFQSVGSLSGGERSRLALARLLIEEPNLLILDEPTTHLDIATREALEQVLLTYTGTLLLVSHDRRLISQLADKLWIVEKGTLSPFNGGYEEWVEQARAAEPVTPAEKRSTRTRNRTRINRPNPPNPQRKPRVTSTERIERDILELENRLEEIEQQLELASAAQDLEAIARLGAEHTKIQSQLEQRWAELGE